SHVGLLAGQGDEHRLPGAIELCSHDHAAWCRSYQFVQMSDHRRPAVELYEAEPPWQPLAEEKIVAMVQDRRGEELAARRLRFPVETDRQALLARLARRILPRAAVPALLQLEAPERRGGGKPQCDATPRRRRQRRQARAQHGVLALGAL